MQLVIKDGVVVATHDDGQNVAGLYPGCQVVTYEGAFTMSPGALDPRTPFAQAMDTQTAALASWQAAKLALGFDTGLGFSLAVGDADQTRLAAYKLMIDMAVAAGTKTTASSLMLSDVNGAVYSVTVAQFYQVILPYGVYCETLFQQYSLASAHLLAATTVDAVNAVVLPT
jgi:hypothetical protein